MFFIQEAVYEEYQGNLYSSRIDYNTYWDRYLDSFETVTVLARVKKVENVSDGFMLSTGSKVSYIPLPFYQGYKGYLQKKLEINKILKNSITKSNAYVLRLPGLLGSLAYKYLRKQNLIYGVEVVGDPYEVSKFLPIPFPIKVVYGYYSMLLMRNVVKNASGILYVTENILQQKYPAKSNALIGFASDVIIKEKDIIYDASNRLKNIETIKGRLKNKKQPPVKIGVVGMLYSIKSPIEIVKTLKILIDKGFNLELNFVGDGPLKTPIQSLSEKLKIKDNVKCLGTIASGKEVFNFLDTIDLYIQFSKTEGMPRAMLEALARGCPTIASKVGGIPEIIPENLLVKSGDIVGFANKIESVLQDKDLLKSLVNQNIEIAKEFTESKLSVKREKYYQEFYNLNLNHVR